MSSSNSQRIKTTLTRLVQGQRRRLTTTHSTLNTPGSSSSTSSSSAASSSSSSTKTKSTSSSDLLTHILPNRIRPLIPASKTPQLVLPTSSLIPASTTLSNLQIPASSAPNHVNINHPTRLFQPPSGDLRAQLLGGFTEGQNKEAVLSAATGMSVDEIRGLNRYTVVLKRVVNMTKKGKMPSLFALLVVGSPSRGLLGIGRGRGDAAPTALDSAFHRAVLSMDWVDKFEGRTVWDGAGGLKGKWGSTEVVLRGRPAGFGLAVPPTIHRILTACGIKDCSATIRGSRNPMQVVKATIGILHGGASPPGFGQGTGKKGQRKNKGQGMRGKEGIERERGRWGIEVGRRL